MLIKTPSSPRLGIQCPLSFPTISSPHLCLLSARGHTVNGFHRHHSPCLLQYVFLLYRRISLLMRSRSRHRRLFRRRAELACLLLNPSPPHRFAGCLSPSRSPSSWVCPLRCVVPFCNVHVFPLQVTNLAMSWGVLPSSSYTPKNSLPSEGFTSAYRYPWSSPHLNHHLSTLIATLSARTRRQSLRIFVSSTRTLSKVTSSVPSSVARIPRVSWVVDRPSVAYCRP